VSLFEDIFGPGPFSRHVEPPPESGTFVLIDSKVFEAGRFVMIHKGKLYRLTAEELDVSTAKPKKRAESTSTDEGRAPQKESRHE
jgi:hypothetical protein